VSKKFITLNVGSGLDNFKMINEKIMSDTKETENKALTIFKEIEKRNINDTVKPKFELCFFDEMGVDHYNKYFNTTEEVMQFINGYDFKKLLKIYNYTERIVFDLETDKVIWEEVK
jgi:hypothetical protein